MPWRAVGGLLFIASFRQSQRESGFIASLSTMITTSSAMHCEWCHCAIVISAINYQLSLPPTVFNVYKYTNLLRQYYMTILITFHDPLVLFYVRHSLNLNINGQCWARIVRYILCFVHNEIRFGWILWDFIIFIWIKR